MNLSLLEFVEVLKNRLGMYVPKQDFHSVSAIVHGFDIGSGQNLLAGFRDWLVEVKGAPSNLHWASSILFLNDLSTLAEASLSSTQNEQAVENLLGLLSEYLGKDSCKVL